MSAALTVLLVAIPLLLAFLSILVKKISPYILLFVSLLNVVLLIFLPDGFVIIGNYAKPVGIALLLNTYSRLALFLINGLIFIITCLNLKEYKSYASILMVALAGLNGLVLTNDLFNLFVFLEISGIAAYLIANSNKKPTNTFHYLIMGAVGSSLFLFGLIILYAMFGTLNMVDMIDKISASGVSYTSLSLPFLLMFIGLGVEAKILPFNSWVKGVLGNSNTMSGPMIASVYAGAMGFVFGRLLVSLFQFQGTLLMIVTIILAVGILLGDMMAFASHKSREILLYSSIAQASIIALLFVNGIINWAVYLILANALSKLVMFLVVNKAAKEVGSDKLSKLSGLFTKNIFVGVTFTIAALSVMGLPLLVGFFIKYKFLMELASNNQILLIAVILLASLIEGIYFVRMLVKLWYKGENEVNVEYNISFKIVFVVIALVLLVFGTYRTPLNNLDNSFDQVVEVVNNG